MKATLRELGATGLLAVFAAVLLLPVGGLMALDAAGVFDTSRSTSWHPSGPPPAWMNPLRFTAPTSDGLLTSLEVAIDAPDSATLRKLSADTSQLTLLLKLQVGSMHSSELKLPGGIDALRDRMLTAVRQRVGDDDDTRVRQVGIGNLMVKSP